MRTARKLVTGPSDFSGWLDRRIDRSRRHNGGEHGLYKDRLPPRPAPPAESTGIAELVDHYKGEEEKREVLRTLKAALSSYSGNTGMQGEILLIVREARTAAELAERIRELIITPNERKDLYRHTPFVPQPEQPRKRRMMLHVQPNPAKKGGVGAQPHIDRSTFHLDQRNRENIFIVRDALIALRDQGLLHTLYNEHREEITVLTVRFGLNGGDPLERRDVAKYIFRKGEPDTADVAYVAYLEKRGLQIVSEYLKRAGT